MSLLEDMLTYFSTLGLVQGAGIDAYIDFKPETPDNVVTLHEYAGDPVTSYMPEVHRSVQIVVRNKSATAARTKAIQLYKALMPADESRRIDFTQDRWGQVYIRQAPYKLSQDEADRTHYGFNIGITTKIE